MGPLVSFVIAAYNQAPFIDAAIRSALNQSYERLEILVADDGSSDGTRESVARYADKVTIFHVERGGPSACLNAGLRAARGEFIAIMSGDDVSLRSRVTQQLDYLGEHKADIVFCVPDIIDGSGRPVPDREFAVFGERRKRSKVDFADLFFNLNYLCASSAMLRREVFDRIGYFDETLVQLSDYDYWLKAAAAGLSLHVSTTRTVEYRRHAKNLSGQNTIPASHSELPHVTARALLHAMPRTTRDSFAQFLPPSISSDKPLTQFELALLFFSHNLASVRSHGIPLFDEAQKSGQLDALPAFSPLNFLMNSLNRVVPS